MKRIFSCLTDKTSVMTDKCPFMTNILFNKKAIFYNLKGE